MCQIWTPFKRHKTDFKQPNKQKTQQVKPINLQKYTISFTFVHRHVIYCCIAHPLQPGVKSTLKKIGHNPDEGQMVKVKKKATIRFDTNDRLQYILLCLDIINLVRLCMIQKCIHFLFSIVILSIVTSTDRASTMS